MKYVEAIICWNANSKDVAVVPFPEKPGGPSEAFEFTSGGCWAHVHNMTRQQIAALVCVEALHMVCAYDVDPNAVFEALSVIEEFTEAMAFSHMDRAMGDPGGIWRNPERAKRGGKT